MDDLTAVASLYVFDDKDFFPRPSTCRPKEWDAVAIGPHAANILKESVDELRRSLRSIGGELIVRRGDPATIIPEIMGDIGAVEIYWNEEPGVYESRTSRQVLHAVQDKLPQVEIRTSMQYTLYHPDDLPREVEEWKHLAQPNMKRSKTKHRSKPTFPERPPLSENMVNITPQRWNGISRIMGDFRRAAREKAPLRMCLPSPTQLSAPTLLSSIDPGNIPSVEELVKPLQKSRRPILGLSDHQVESAISSALRRCVSNDESVLRGGEQQGLRHLKDFVQNHAATAKRNLACVSGNQSSQLSHYLAFGCLSPRKVVEAAQAQGDDCNWIVSHMTMRDFFLYTCLASDYLFYQQEGIPVSKKAGKAVEWNNMDRDETQAKWRCWASGETGLPLVDAGMQELIQTGYCSNRVRQNAASVLTKDLGVDWRAGAEWFQFLLGDHCVGANWGNWLYFSGVGPDPKQRHFRTVSQALKYDKEGTYVRKWLPQLSQMQEDESHLRPWDYNIEWRDPIVSPQTQYTWQDLQRLQESGEVCQTSEEEKRGGKTC